MLVRGGKAKAKILSAITQNQLCLYFPVSCIITPNMAQSMISAIKQRLQNEGIVQTADIKSIIVVQPLINGATKTVYLHNMKYSEYVSEIYLILDKRNINNIEYLTSVLSMQIGFDVIA